MPRAEARDKTHDQRRRGANIESRPLWKPMHLQPVFKDCLAYTNGVSEALFRDGVCLPSGSALTEEELQRVCDVVRGEIADSR